MDETATGQLPAFAQKALRRYFDTRVRQSWQGEHILHGKPIAPQALNLSSNDYLSISRHPLLIAAEITALHDYGNGHMQSSVFLQQDSLLQQTERHFADFVAYPDCLLLQSGWCANISVIQALSEPDTPVYLDLYAHKSFWEGAQSAGAKIIPFQHNCQQSLYKRLKRYGSGIIAVDSVYSTHGDISPLRDYAQLADEFNCLFIVDESHSLGTHGEQGRGLVHALGLNKQVDVVTASLAKALAGRGGMIASSTQFAQLIRYTALPSIFSSTLLPHDLAGFTAALTIIKEEEWRRQKLHDNAQFLRQALYDAGINIGACASQIIPLFSGSEHNAIALRKALEQQAIHGAVFCAPATPKNQTLIRLSINTDHNPSQLVKVAECLLAIKSN